MADSRIDLDPPEKEELEEAQSKGSLLFRLWAEARAHKERMRTKAETAAADTNAAAEADSPAGSTLVDAPSPDDIMPRENNFLQLLRLGPSTPKKLPYEVLPVTDFVLAAVDENGDAAPAAQQPAEPEPEPVPEPVLYSSFMMDGAEPNHDQRAFLVRLQTVARKRLDEFKTPGPDGEPIPLDAMCCVGLSMDNYSAFAFLLPPCGGGADITPQAICEALAAAGVTYGLKEETIAAAAEQKQYMLMFTAALGSPCINGQDGRIIDRYSRVKRISLVEKENRTVDYKDLNWLQRASAGDVICEIIPPVPPQDGCTVQGRVIAGRQGRAIAAPIGKNTVLSEDGTLLTAAVDGQVTFSSQRFQVEQLLVVNTDLGPETGNLDVVGNVVIKGNVLEGFSVRASGDITISGMAEGAVVMAGGSIQVGMGMNGNSHGMLGAGGNIVSKYLENCTATAGGNICAENIINCNICCDDSVLVTNGRGVIIGGHITALNAIEANAVGNRSSRATSLTLGSTPGFLSKKAQLENSLKEIYLTQSAQTKNLNFLTAKGKLTVEQQKLFADTKVKLSALKVKLASLESEYKEMVEKQLDMTGCRIYCKCLFPPTQIIFGSSGIVVREMMEHCNIYYNEGEIRFSTRL